MLKKVKQTLTQIGVIINFNIKISIIDLIVIIILAKNPELIMRLIEAAIQVFA